MEKLKILYRGGQAEIVEKKSRFITHTIPVDEEQQALDYIAGLKKEYWDARHNCWAYVIGDRHQLARCSDDGEPQGTAGRPMLDVLLGEDVHNACVVVTRYFGGVLLGTGGLVRAYSSSVSEGLKASVILEKVNGFALTIQTDYNGLGKIQYLLLQAGLTITDTRYTDSVEIDTLVPEDQYGTITAAITEGTSGKAVFARKEPVCFAFDGAEPVLF